MVISSIQALNAINNFVSDFIDSSLNAHTTVNNEQQSSIDIVTSITSQATLATGIVFTLRAQMTDSLTSAGQLSDLRIHSITQFIVDSTHSQIGAAPVTSAINITHTAIVQSVEEFVSNRVITDITHSSLKSFIQFIILNTLQLENIHIFQVFLQQGSIVGSAGFILVGIRGGLRINTGGSTASQHRNSHNASEHQRSNFLEFHSEFFLLMVYKR